MTRFGFLLLVCVAAAGAAAGAVPRPPADLAVRASADLTPPDDPFPLNRVRASDAKLAALLKELEAQGPVVRLPRSDFEARVRAAGRAVGRAKTPPRLVETSYKAQLDPAGELTGTAELTVLNGTGAGAFLPLDPLKLAVREAKWASGGEAVVTVPPGAPGPAVWTAPGPGVVQFKWSLVGTAEPGERRFDLRVPPCPVATLELDVPADQVPAARADALMTGPFDVPGRPNRRLWKVRFGGRSRLELTLRPGGAAAAGASATVAARYDLGPGQLAAAFEFDLSPARGSVAEWSFLADPGLRITDVAANNRSGWTVDPPATPNGPRRVRVTLRQPAQGGKVLVAAVAPFPDPARGPDAPLPAVRPLGAVVDGETLELRLAAGLKIESWSPGDYALTDVTPTSDQGRVLYLTPALVAPGADEPFRRLPAVRVAVPEAQFVTFERLEWRPGRVASSLVARVQVRATRGTLFHLALRPPPGYALDRGFTGADELVAHIGPPTGAGNVVELLRPLAAGQQAELRFEFRGPGVAAGEAVPFPAFAVSGAAERDGWLSVSADPTSEPAIRPGAGARPGGLWGWLTTDAPTDARAVFPFHAREPDGTLALSPARPHVRSEAVVFIDQRGGRWYATTRLTLQVAGGLPGALVFVPGPHDPGREWRLTDPANAVAEAVPLPSALVSLGNAGTVWALRFARPVSGTVALETAAPTDSNGRTGVPRLAGIEQPARVELAPTLTGRATAERTGDAIVVRAIEPVGGAFPVSDAYLLTAVREPGDVLAAFGGTVRGCPGGVLPVELPPGAEVRGAIVAGRWVPPALCARDPDGRLRVPLPAGPAVRFEVRYRLPAAGGWPTRRVDSPAPVVPGGAEVTRWWSFAPGTLPGWPARPWDATRDLPPLLGGPLLAGSPAVVTRSDDRWVRVGTARGADALAAGLAALAVAVGLLTARRHLRAAVVLGAVALAALTAAEVGPPWWARAAWPVLAAAVLALARVAVVARAGATPPAVIAATLVALGTIPLVRLAAQPSAPATALLVAGSDGNEDALAPRALLDRLDALAKPLLPAPAVAAAAYDVQATDAGAQVTARFTVHAFRPGENAVALPLSDVRLAGATVNGAAAFPAAVRPDAYSIPLGGPGRYDVEVRFAAGVAAAGAERELRFGVPECPDARVTAALPGSARQPLAVGRAGRQTATAGERATVTAELGAVRHVHLRWREGAAGSAAVRVREGCVWEVKDGHAGLTAAYFVRVEQGTVSGLRFDVPAELEVLRVAVRADGGAPPPGLRDWKLDPEKGGLRALRLDFQAPAAGRFLVLIECAPRKPLARQPVLRFPRPAFGPKGEPDAVYGLRTGKGTAVEEFNHAGVLDLAADGWKEFLPVADLKLDPAAPLRAFRPGPGAAAELRPVLRAGDPPAARHATAWHVGPHRADATGVVTWSGERVPPVVEFVVPGAEVLEVRGSEVTGWGRTGNRVQVWLRPGAKEAQVEWFGTAVPVPRGKAGAGAVPFDPGVPVVAGARTTGADVRVRAVDGWTVRADRAKGWQAVPGGGELRFRADGPAVPGLRVVLVP